MQELQNGDGGESEMSHCKQDLVSSTLAAPLHTAATCKASQFQPLDGSTAEVLPKSRFSRWEILVKPDATGPARSPPLSPGQRNISPVTTRPRSSTFSGRIVIQRSNIQTVPRDPEQPKRGSISDLPDQERPADCEEDDTFHLTPFPRQRATTCPEQRAFRRRALARQRARPATPPPLDLSHSHIMPEREVISQLVTRERLHISDRDLPLVQEDT